MSLQVPERTFVHFVPSWLTVNPPEQKMSATESKLLETFPNPKPSRDFLITHVAPEFTSVCPKTGQPDYGTITLEYLPSKSCVELKSYKFYLQSFRNRDIFYEAVTNQILDDLVAACSPRRMTVVGDFSVRGGIATTVTAAYEKGKAPAARARREVAEQERLGVGPQANKRKRTGLKK